MIALVTVYILTFVDRIVSCGLTLFIILLHILILKFDFFFLILTLHTHVESMYV